MIHVKTACGGGNAMGWMKIAPLKEETVMKRLTEPRGFVNGIACQERGVELYWRLKQYEDIGLEPEELKEILEHLGIEIGQLRQELVDERYRHDRLLDFEVAEAEELQKLREQFRWVPVTERLPKTIPCGAGTEYSEAINILTSGRKVLTAIWNGSDFIADAEFWEAENEEITHWAAVPLPLPEGTKEF